MEHAESYAVPQGADWAVWDAPNGVLSFMSDAEAVRCYRENAEDFGRPDGHPPPDEATPEQAWAAVDALWDGDPGGAGWRCRLVPGSTWLRLRWADGDRIGDPEFECCTGPLPAGVLAPGYDERA